MAGGEQGNEPMVDDLPDWLNTFTCSNGVHFFLGNEPVCTCPQGVRSAYVAQAATPPGPYGLLAGYKPSVNSGQPPLPPAPKVEIAESVKRAAIEAGATHLSVDGGTAFMLRMGVWCRAFWDSEGHKFDSWYSCEGLPGGVVELGE